MLGKKPRKMDELIAANNRVGVGVKGKECGLMT